MTDQTDIARKGRGLLTVNALVFGALGIGFLNNVTIAAIFGLTRQVDAFFAASMLPSLFMALCVDYLGKNFLPVLATAKQQSEDAASTMTSSVVTIVTLLTVAVTVLLALFSRPLFDLLLPGFSAEEIDVVVKYFWIMAPALVFMAVNTFHEYVRQYDDQFVYVSASRLALPAANLLGIVLLAPWLGEYCLPVGFLVGHVTVFVMLARRVPYRFRPRVTVRADLERRVFANSAIVMSTGLIARTRSIILNYLASMLGGGAITALALTTKLTEPLERGAFAGARMMMFSHTARLFVERNEQELGRLYREGLRMSFLLLAPLLWWVALNSTEIVKAFFLRGEFTPEMAFLVAGTLVGMIPSVLFMGVNQMLSNAFYAMNRVKVPAIVMPLGTVAYVGIAVPLAAVLGTQGLAVATTVTSILTFIALFICLSRLITEIKPLGTAGRLISYLVLAGGTSIVVSTLLTSLELPLGIIATASLPMSVILYSGALALIGDETFKQLIAFAKSCVRRDVPEPPPPVPVPPARR